MSHNHSVNNDIVRLLQLYYYYHMPIAGKFCFSACGRIVLAVTLTFDFDLNAVKINNSLRSFSRKAVAGTQRHTHISDRLLLSGQTK